MYKSSGRIEALDIIRSFALFLIVIYHFNYIAVPFDIRVMPMDHIGPVGVGLYLFLSGALLMYHNKATLSLTAFYKKRIRALLLPFWVAYVMVFLYNFLIGIKPVQTEAWKFIFTIIGMDGFLSYRFQTFYLIGEWFLGCIILYYFLFPLLRTLILKVPRLMAAGVLLLFIKNVSEYSWSIPLLWNPIILLPNFMCGMYFGEFMAASDGDGKKEFNKDLLAAAFLCYIASVAGVFKSGIYNITVETVSLFLILYFIGSKIKYPYVKTLCNVLSKNSYGMILFHHVVMFELRRILPESAFQSYTRIITFIFVIIISLLLSVLLSKITDKIKQMLDYKHWRVNV